MTDDRTPERLRAHYEVEKALAARLRGAPSAERLRLYAGLYDELFRRVPDHPQLTRPPTVRRAAAARELRRLRPYLTPGLSFLEVGAGDCALSLQVAALVRHVYAVDVSAEITKAAVPQPNFTLVLSDGCSVPVPAGTIDLAYSNQLMEHLHPDDAARQLRSLHAALRPGGRYLCLTPNRLSGPHDISRYFDQVAAGFHLQEYTLTELAGHFRAAGFSRVAVPLSLGRHAQTLPLLPFLWLERLLAARPAAQRRRMSALRPIRLLLGIRLIAIK